MADSLLEQAIFGVYEVFANIIPGFILLITSILLIYPSLFEYMTEVPESFLFILLFFSSFVLGLALQGLSAMLERIVNKRKYGGYPSTLYLKDNDQTFPEYFKKTIRQAMNKEFGTPLEASPQHIFDLCYAYVIQNKVSTRVATFLRTYTFARNMTVAMILEFAICLVGSLWYGQTSIALAGIMALVSSYLFYKRFLRYSESFAKEVLRSFFIDRASGRTFAEKKEDE